MTTRAGNRGTTTRGTKAGTRGERGVATRQEIPRDLADRWELMVKLTSERLYELHKNIREAVGSRPYKGLPVSEKELAGRWSELVNDPQALTELFHTNAKYTVDGRVLVPNELLETMTTQHKHRQLGGYD